MLKYFKYIWLPAIIAIIIFYLCCIMTSNDIPDVEWEFFIETDKIIHFLMYFGLSAVASFNYIYIKKGHIIILKLIAFTILVPILYGGLIEIIQSEYCIGRTGDWFDFGADTLGSLASLPFSFWFRRFMLNRQEE